MAQFPTLSTGAVTQYPSSRTLDYATGVLQFVDGTEQRFRSLKSPVRRWIIRLSKVNERELYALEEFFHAQRASMESFSFTDPWDGTIYPNCTLESDELELRFLADGHAAATVVIRSNLA